MIWVLNIKQNFILLPYYTFLLNPSSQRDGEVREASDRPPNMGQPERLVSILLLIIK